MAFQTPYGSPPFGATQGILQDRQNDLGWRRAVHEQRRNLNQANLLEHAKLANALQQQQLQNRGQFDVTRLAQEAETRRTMLGEQGQTNRLGMTNRASMNELQESLNMDRLLKEMEEEGLIDRENLRGQFGLSQERLVQQGALDKLAKEQAFSRDYSIPAQLDAARIGAAPELMKARTLQDQLDFQQKTFPQTLGVQQTRAIAPILAAQLRASAARDVAGIGEVGATQRTLLDQATKNKQLSMQEQLGLGKLQLLGQKIGLDREQMNHTYDLQKTASELAREKFSFEKTDAKSQREHDIKLQNLQNDLTVKLEALKSQLTPVQNFEVLSNLSKELPEGPLKKQVEQEARNVAITIQEQTTGRRSEVRPTLPTAPVNENLPGYSGNNYWGDFLRNLIEQTPTAPSGYYGY